jgi:hypothetical protein
VGQHHKTKASEPGEGEPAPLDIIIGRRRGKLEKIWGRRDMERTRQHEMGRRQLPAGLPLALGISLACHVLFALLGYTLFGAKVSQTSYAPLAESLLTVPESQITLSLEDVSRGRQRKATAQSISEPEAGFTVRVNDLPPSFPVAAPACEQDPSSSGPRPTGSGKGPGADAPGSVPAFFGIAARGQTVVFLIDRSISMGLNGGLAAAKRELLNSVSRLPPTTRVGVLFYSGAVQSLRIAGQTGLVAVSDAVRAELARLVDVIRPEGGTNHLPAFRQALALRPDVLFFVTDGDDLTQRDVENLTRLNAGRTIIHVLEWNAGERADAALRTLARYNRGSYKSLGSASAAARK